MPEPAAYVLLALGVVAYLGGACLLVAAAGQIVARWWRDQTARAPDDPPSAAMLEQARTAMAAVAAAGEVTPPAVGVVRILGTPTGGSVVGDGGLAVTRIPIRRPATVVFARAALTELTPAALRSLAAHELAHVVRTEATSTIRRFSGLAGYVLLVCIGGAVTTTALLVAPPLAGPALLATTMASVAFLALLAALGRRAEIAADLYAIEVTGDLVAAAELMDFYVVNVAKPGPSTRLGRAWAQCEQRWFATHPSPQDRLAAMRRHLGM